MIDFGIDLSDEEELEIIEDKIDEEKVYDNFYVPSAISYSVTVEIVLEDTMKKKSYDM